MNRGLLIVDVQNDFCEGGALGVASGSAVAEGIADLIATRPGLYSALFVSQDWHNPLPDLNGGHFAAPGEQPDYESSWPVHCVAGTSGAEIRPELAVVLEHWHKDLRVIHKGSGRPDYSAFQGRTMFGQLPLGISMDQIGITDLDVVGIATDHCVRASALDALRLIEIGHRLKNVRVIHDLCAGVQADTSALALKQMEADGARIIQSTWL